jgi:hypothetical protein
MEWTLGLLLIGSASLLVGVAVWVWIVKRNSVTWRWTRRAVVVAGLYVVPVVVVVLVDDSGGEGGAFLVIFGPFVVIPAIALGFVADFVAGIRRRRPTINHPRHFGANVEDDSSQH